MKKKILGKLTLGKRSIASLTPESMTQVQGGISVNGDDDCGPRNTVRTCPPATNTCPTAYPCVWTDCCTVVECNPIDSRPCP